LSSLSSPSTCLATTSAEEAVVAGAKSILLTEDNLKPVEATTTPNAASAQTGKSPDLIQDLPSNLVAHAPSSPAASSCSSNSEGRPSGCCTAEEGQHKVVNSSQAEHEPGGQQDRTDQLLAQLQLPRVQKEQDEDATDGGPQLERDRSSQDLEPEDR
jgi:hypothetical protein